MAHARERDRHYKKSHPLSVPSSKPQNASISPPFPPTYNERLPLEAVMRLLKEWPPDRKTSLDKRKRENLEFIIDEAGRKKQRTEDDDYSRSKESFGAANDEGTSLLSPSSLHSDSPAARATIPSPNKPITHDARVFPPSPLSRSPEHSVNVPAADVGQSNESSHSTSIDHTYESESDSKQPKPPRIDTSRVLSALDPRSPKYGIGSASGKDESPLRKIPGQDQRKASIDSYPSDSNPATRRPSEAMPPPFSGSAKGPGSESSTPKAISTPKIASTPMALPDQEPLTHNFSGFAQSIISASSVNVKLDNLNELAIQNETDNRRNQKFNVAYHSLMDRTNLRREASNKAKIRLSKQFETHTTNQSIIASQLDNRFTQPAVKAINEPNGGNTISLIRKEIANMRKELQGTRNSLDKQNVDIRKELQAIQTTLDDQDKDVRKELQATQNVLHNQDTDVRKELEAIQIALDEQQRKGLRQKDLDRYARKAVRHDDLAHFVYREDLSSLEKKLTALNPELKNIGGKVSDLAVVTGERHRDAQIAQEHNATRFQGLDMTLTKVQALQSDLDKRLNIQKEDFTVREADYEKLQDSLTNLEHAVQGSPDHDNLGLVTLAEKNETRLTKMQDAAEQLAERANKLEQAMKNERHHRSRTPPEDEPRIFHGEIQALRQDLDTLADDQNKEYSVLAEGIHNLEVSMEKCQDQLFRSTDDAVKKHSAVKSPNSLQANSPITSEGLDRIKLEKLETDLKALDTQFVVQKKQFDNLTTEHLAQCIINQTKQLYKEHPGHVQDKLRLLETRQNWNESYITQNLEPRLAHMSGAINSRAASDAIQALNIQIQKNFEHIANTTKELAEGINVLKGSVNSQGDALGTLQENANLNFVTATKRLDLLQADVEKLDRETQSKPAANRAKLIEYRAGINGKTFSSSEEDEKTNARRPTTSTPSSRKNVLVDSATGSATLSADEYSGRHVTAARKRKSFSRISDSEDDDGPLAARKLARRAES